MRTKVKHKKRTVWGAKEEETLIALWAERINQFRSRKKRGNFYNDMAKGLEESGYSYTPKEVVVKIYNLSTRYRLEMKKIRTSGRSSDWPLCSSIHSLIGNSEETLPSKPASTLNCVASSGDEAAEISPLPSPKSSESVETPFVEPINKVKTNCFQRSLLKVLTDTNKKIDEEMERSSKVEEKFLAQFMQAEEKRKEMLEKLLATTSGFYNRFLNSLERN